MRDKMLFESKITKREFSAETMKLGVETYAAFVRYGLLDCLPCECCAKNACMFHVHHVGLVRDVAKRLKEMGVLGDASAQG